MEKSNEFYLKPMVVSANKPISVHIGLLSASVFRLTFPSWKQGTLSDEETGIPGYYHRKISFWTTVDEGKYVRPPVL